MCVSLFHPIIVESITVWSLHLYTDVAIVSWFLEFYLFPCWLLLFRLFDLLCFFAAFTRLHQRQGKEEVWAEPVQSIFTWSHLIFVICEVAVFQFYGNKLRLRDIIQNYTIGHGRTRVSPSFRFTAELGIRDPVLSAGWEVTHGTILPRLWASVAFPKK